MRKARSRLAGGVLAVLAFGATLAFPRPLGDGDRLSSADEPEDVCRVPRCEGGPPGWVERIDARLERRIPSLGDGDRRRLARTIVSESLSARIDPLLVLALIEVESSYDHEATSRRGARGLMQLRGPTLRRELERAGLDWHDRDDPAVNVQAGVRYLRRLLDAFGREEVALMAYNAGPNRILGYLRAGEIPDRFRGYPRRVATEVRRLRRSLGVERGPALVVAAGSGWPPVAE